MIECRTNIVRRSITKPTENFVGLPDGGNDYDVPIRLGGAVVWAPGGGGGGANPAVTNFTNQTQVHVLHNRGYRPKVTVTLANGDECDADISHTNTNEFYVQFAAATSGSVNYF